MTASVRIFANRPNACPLFGLQDLLRFASKVADRRPMLMCGDFNAEPTEPVYGTIVNGTESISLSSAYADMVASKSMACSEAAAAAAHHPAAVVDTAAAVGSPNVNDSNASAEPGSLDASGRIRRADVLAAQEPPFTTWKIREEGEVCHTIDYVFYTPDRLRVQNCLMFPAASEIGADRTPSMQYPSDHFSLVCDFEFVQDEPTSNSTGSSS